tara:strand:+ start:9014 stop:9982 length:969 start_codon:yes stop_codon:yes gene_type:complete
MTLDNFRLIIVVGLSSIVIVSCGVSSQSAIEKTGAEAFSLMGKPLFPLPLNKATQDIYLDSLATALSSYEAKPDDSDAIIWYGRRIAYLGGYRESIAIFSEGIRKHPEDARMYRHRGHRYITTRQLDKAIADLEYAARLTNGKKDIIEPDGLPNKLNIPTSTLQSNIWYHLGLTHYVLGNLDAAHRSYQKCLQVSKNNDMLAATMYWIYLTLRRMGERESADFLLTKIGDDFDVIENYAYRDLLLLFKGIIDESDILSDDGNALQNTTIAYGVASWRCIEGDIDGAGRLLDSIISSNYWPAFGYIAAEADVASGRCYKGNEK